MGQAKNIDGWKVKINERGSHFKKVKMKVGHIQDFSMNNGEGHRLVIFMTGCIHACPGCHNKALQDYHYGVEWSIQELIERIREAKSWIDGITLSGGDPLFQLNNTIALLKAIKKEDDLKHLTVWVYTGYNFEDIPKKVKDYVDTFVEGKYVETLPEARWRGSENQRIFRKWKRGEWIESVQSLIK